MPTWGWILIAAVVVLIVAAAAYSMMVKRRSRHLKDRFGPEYDRALREGEGRRGGEQELVSREKRREEMDIRDLGPEARRRYTTSWQQTQARFVDQPSTAVREADDLVMSVMRDRGYPVENFEQQSADVSVDHPKVVDNYRAAHAISLANDHDQAGTEDLRQAMVHYRALFEELLGQDRTAAVREVS